MRFQQLVKKTSMSNCFRPSSNENQDESYTELPAVTVRSPEQDLSAPNSPTIVVSAPVYPKLLEGNNNKTEDK